MAELLKSEKKLRAKETHFSHKPKSAVDFQRALLTSPNSSFLWIQYAANRIETESPEAGKAVLMEAIQKIGIHEEREKLNLYFAWMNYERGFGTQDDFEVAYESALEANNPEQVMYHRIRKSLGNDDAADAKSTFESICKRFGQNLSNWSRYIDFLLTYEKDQSAAEVAYTRGKQALDDHSGALERAFATALFKTGFVERGRTMLEHMLGMKPKRGDLWNLYLDMEAKHGSEESQRELFERALTVPFGKNTVRGLFKRYITFEMEHGDESAVEAIKLRARKYVKETYSG